MHKYGECSIESGSISHRKGEACATIPPRDWQIPIEHLTLVAEFTAPGGPVFDYSYIFVVERPPMAYQVPMEALEDVGIEVFFHSLESELGSHLHRSLAASVGLASSIMWPTELAGQPLFDFAKEPEPNTFLERLRWRFSPRVSIEFSSQVSDFAGGTIEWAT